MSAAYARQTISGAAARRVISAAERAAAALGVPASIAVVDESGVAKAFSRMDGAPLMTVQVAQDKAYTAAGFGFPTHAWHEVMTGHAALAMGAPAGIERLIVFGGGLPLAADGVPIGGVGVSGGTPEQDLEIAGAAVAALAGAEPE